MRKLGIFAILFAMLGLAACNSSEGEETTTVDRKPLLENIGNNLIVPSYQAFATATASLNASVQGLASSPSAEALAAARSDFRTAYLAWQNCSQFEFGPADANLLRNSINIFPTNTEQIQANISAGSYDLNALSNNTAKGFPALDYLLYGIADSDAGIVEAFEQANAAQYLQDVTADIDAKAQTVYNAWIPSEGNYLATFMAAEGTDQGSGLGQLVNSYAEDYELNKNFKLGVPSGIKLLGQKFPEKAEGYYSGLSLELIKENFKASERVFLGTGLNGGNGAGLQDLLRDHNANQLAEDIIAQYGKLFNALNALPQDFLTAIETDQAGLQVSYDEAQAMVVLIKTEMTSVFGVQISYQDGDND